MSWQVWAVSTTRYRPYIMIGLSTAPLSSHVPLPFAHTDERRSCCPSFTLTWSAILTWSCSVVWFALGSTTTPARAQKHAKEKLEIIHRMQARIYVMACGGRQAGGGREI